MKSIQGPKRNHHVTPAFYLKGFGVKPECTHVWEYCRNLPYKPGEKREHSNPCRRSIKKKAGMIKDYFFYKTIVGTEEHERVENILEKQESVGKKTLSQIRAREPIDIAGKVALSFYIEMMVMRGPSRMKRAEPFVDDEITSMPWDLLARKAAEEGRFSEALLLMRDRDDGRARIKRELLRKGSAIRNWKIVEAIAKMRWIFLNATGSQFFVTSDNPVVFDKTLGLGAFGRENSWLIFPVSSHVALMALHSPTPSIDYLEATEDQVRSINEQVLRSTEVYSYACSAEAWILDVWRERLSQ